MAYMFRDCSGLTSLDLSNFIIQDGYYNLDGFFGNCTSLKTIKINDEASANKLIARIKADLNKTATWDPETKIITIPE